MSLFGLLHGLPIALAVTGGDTGVAAASGGVAADAPQDEGSLPAVDTPSDVVRAGSFPGSFLIPGTDVSIGFGGRIKLDGIHDRDAIGSTDSFVTSSIPVPEVASDGNTVFHARDTRLHMEVRSPSQVGVIRGYVEGNFFGSGNSFVLRHAYAETEQLLAGQTWTNFMMIDSRPETLDFEGPDSSIFLRQGQLRWTEELGSELHGSVALEDPGSDVLAPAGSAPEQVFPDFTVGLRRDHSEGHLFLSGILRQIGYSGASSDSVLGWGASLSGRVPTWNKDNIRFQAAYGHGIARYVEDLRGLGLDAAADAGGDLEALPTFGGFLSYQHFWRDDLRSTLVFAATGVDNSAGQADSTLRRTSYGALNLIWTAAERLDLGIEILRGTRENKDRQDADALRLQVSVIYTL